MIISQVSTRGSFHPQNNEDALVTCSLGPQQHLLAVMDGCSSGQESHFAPVLMAKLLRKAALDYHYRTFVEQTVASTQDILTRILEQVFNQLVSVKGQLHLSTEELLATLLLAVVDAQKREAEVVIIGDGLVACNGQTYEYDQDNHPDYWAFHLQQDFAVWRAQHEQWLRLTEVNDLSLATDGIFSFRATLHATWPKHTILMNSFLHGPLSTEEGLLQTLRYWEMEEGLVPSDDMTVLRMQIE